MHFNNRFTEVSGNKPNSSVLLLPSALADGHDKFLLESALAPFVFYLNEKFHLHVQGGSKPLNALMLQ